MADLDFALYGSDGAEYFAGRSDYKAMSASNGSGGPEYFTYNVTTAGWYGLCVWACDGNSANYTLKVEVEEAGIWKGLVSTNWNTPDNWSGNMVPTPDVDVTIPSGTPYSPIVSSGIATCKSLEILTSASLTIGGYYLTVANNLDVSGTLNMNNNYGQLMVNGDVTWHANSTAGFTAAARFTVFGDWVFNDGANVNLDQGTVYFEGTTDKYILSNSSTCSFNIVGCYKSGGAKLGISYNSTQALTITGALYVNQGAIFAIYSTHDVKFERNLTSDGSFICNFGTVVLNGGSHSLKMNVNDYFNNLTFNQSGTVTLDPSLSNVLNVKKDVVISSGTFSLDDNIMKVGGKWTNTVGPDGFLAGSSRVIFNSTGYNYVKTSETFNILEVNMGNALRVDNASSVVTCNQYDWTTGGIDVMAGTFTALDLYDNGIFGNYWVKPGGTINLTNDGWVDLAANLNITGGYFNVYGGTTDSYWPYGGDASINMSGGYLDFKNTGIYIPASSSYTFTENITGGTIRTSGNFNINTTTFTPSGGTVELYGSLDAGISNFAGSNLHNLAINKSGASDEGSGALFTQDRNGKKITLSRTNQVLLDTDVLINGNLTVNAGKLITGMDSCVITCMGSASFENGATLEMTPLSSLKLNTSLTVNNGGTFQSTEATVTRAATNHYLFEVQSGANIGASETIFEYMGANGINIASGAVVDPIGAFNHCTFRQGASANTLLTMNSTQTLECTGAIFPTNTWGGTNNVKKTNNAGRITFYDYSGNFAGAAYESDPNSRIDWFTAGLSASPFTLNVTPPAGTATISVTSNLAWTATESSPWFSISPTSGTNNGTITVTYDKNSSASSRSGSITISAPSVPDVVVTVNQSGATLAVTPASQSVTAPAGTTTFSVASNTAWMVSKSVSWFMVAPMSGTANGTLTVNYNQNPSVTPRSGQITISSTGLPNVIVTVNQAGVGATLTVTPANRNVSPPAGTTTFSVVSNTGWVVTESVAWFTENISAGNGNTTLTVDYDQNNTGSPRVGNILLTATGGAPVVTVSVTQSAYPSQAISLSAGWQGLSSYIMPTDNNIENVFAPLSPNFIIAQTMSGIYYPAGPINTIGTWMSQSAYTVKMENAAWLSIFGMPETDKTYDLTAGWNLIPVIANNPVNVATLPTTVGFQIVKEVAGTGIYWPAMSINTLGNLLPGKAYYVRVTSVGTITFPANTDAGWEGKYPEATLLQTPWNQSVASPVSHLIAFAPGATAELMAGDIVGLFTPDNICCGVALVEMPGEPLAITAFADDAQQPGTSGYLSGQTISLKIYRPATNEVGMLTAVYEPAGNGDVFADHGLSVITRIQQTATGIGTISTAAVDIYPNPTDGTITLTGIGQYSLMQLYSAHGELLLQRTNDAADELRWDVSALPPGVYQLKLSGNHPAVVKKLIRN